MVCLECPGNNNSSLSTFPTSTGTGNLSHRLPSKYGIVQRGSEKDFTRTAFSNRVVLQHHNVMDHGAANLYNAALVRMIVYAKLSFNLVESKSYRAYVKTLNSNTQIVSRRTFVRNIEDSYSRTLPLVKKDLDNVYGMLSITCDGCPSRLCAGTLLLLSAEYPVDLK